MKRRVGLLLVVLVLVLSGCKQQMEEVSTAALPVSADNQSQNFDSAESAYYHKYTELTAVYGTGALVHTDGMEGGSYLSGVCAAYLLDFNTDGAEDLFVVYFNGGLTGKDRNGAPIPQSASYEIEVWTFADGKLKQLLHESQAGSFDSFITESWDTDNCFITLYENKQGAPVIQLYGETEYGCSYKKIYFENNRCVNDYLSYKQQTFKLNGLLITESRWQEETSRYHKILGSIFLSSPGYDSTGLWESQGIDYNMTLAHTEKVVSALAKSEPVEDYEASGEYISLYLEQLDYRNRDRLDQDESYYPVKYGLYDMNGDDTPELIVFTGNSEASYTYHFYTVADHQLIDCGELSGGHASLYINGSEIMMLLGAHMGEYFVSDIRLDGTRMCVDEVSSGKIQDEYPDLADLGLGDYTDWVKMSYGLVPELLYSVNEGKKEYPIVLTPTIRHIESAYYSEGIFCIFTGQKFGFMSDEGEEITPYHFDFAYPFHEGVACVKKNGMYGFIDQAGNEKLPLIYDRANSFSEGLAYFETGDTYGFMNQSGETVFLLDCDSISSFREGRAVFSVDGAYGYLDKTGKQIIPAIYDDADYFSDGLAEVRKGAYIGVIDSNGSEVIPIKYESVEVDDQYIKAHRDGKEHYFDYSGNPVEAPAGELIYPDSGYDTMLRITGSGLAIVSLEDKYGIVDGEGVLQIPLQYDRISIPYGEETETKYVFIRRGDKEGVLCLEDFNVTIEPSYDIIYPFQENHAIVYIDGEYGLIDEAGKMVISPGDYKYIFSISDRTICLEKDDRYYLAKNNGEIRSDRYYDDINQFSKAGSYQIYQKDGKKGLLDEYGNEVLLPDFHYITGSDNGIYRSETSFLATDYNSAIRESIIITDKYKRTDLSNVILTNEITPRISPYHELIRTGKIDEGMPIVGGNEGSVNTDTIKTLKLYYIEDCLEPILYYYEQPPYWTGFPASASAFYGIDGNEAAELVTGYECGGSFRGDHVQLYLEKDTGKTIIGSCGFYGGFGGYASSYGFIHMEKDEITGKDNLSWIGQRSSGFLYDTDYILEHAKLFYGEDGNPLNKETIMDAEYMETYTINEELVTTEQYDSEKSKYIMIPMRFK